MSVSIKTVRDRLRLYLSEEVGAVAGLSLKQLHQVIAGSFHPIG